jgi:putative transposase
METPIRKQCVRFNEPGHAHELTFSCYRRWPLLTRDRTRLWLAEAIDAARARLQFDLWAYVFMPEHVHLLIYPRRPDYRIASILWWIKRPVAKRVLRYLAEHSPDWLAKLSVTRADGRIERRFWQAGGGYDRNLMEPSTIHRVMDYIHGNPVRRGLVAQPEEWAWSSAGYYAGQRPVKLEIEATLVGVIGV